MKRKSFLSTVAKVFADDPSLMICYDVKTAYFAKSKDWQESNMGGTVN
mgnify:CR=1 FL=1